MNLNARTLRVSGWLFIFLTLAFVLLVWRPSPPDDFLRHIRYAEYAPLGGYSYMFPASYFQSLSWDPWYGFDQVAGFVNAQIGPYKTIFFFQLLSVWLFSLGIIMNCENRDKYFLLQVVFFFGLLSLTMNRLLLIRPCIFLGVVFFLSIKGERFWTGFLTSLICAVLYYLFFLYTIPLVIGHYLKGSRKFGYGVALGTLLSLAGWLVITKLGLLAVLWHTVGALLSSREGLVIVENTLSVDQLKRLPVYLITLFFLATIYKKREVDIYAVLLAATAPLALQARYLIDLTIPLMVLYVLRHSDEIAVFFIANKRVFEALALVSILLVIPGVENVSMDSSNTVRLDGLDLPRGSTVFLPDGLPNNFSAIFWNRTPIRVIPSAEIGWNDTDTVRQIKEIQNKRVIPEAFCSYAKNYRINYVLSETASSASCLRYVTSFHKGKRVDLFEDVSNQVTQGDMPPLDTAGSVLSASKFNILKGSLGFDVIYNKERS